ncbi:MAG: hypothetical protein UY77_C0003G0017 [Candidatus Uhrbacteria bacterium GW2011_GWA2_53_10]|uniref:HicB-like antitoxin of toxin-antitoxin system domain-containing protein n=1 Tax=Candidatus Uhrbacteria bacterium GW2011_GWA2_53_10 TaxID=1618980 RepID=A0A0G1XPS1_9BACT|nr:MAG: hypothetical protein UY77_C0003G0017 [Candidatus Uhrbacteria bacterium GW2011_GWA2_53_10]
MKSIRKTINQFPVIVQEDETGGFWVSCPTLDGCYSQGETIDQALRNMQEAILLTLEDIPKKKQRKLLRKRVSLHLVGV